MSHTRKPTAAPLARAAKPWPRGKCTWNHRVVVEMQKDGQPWFGIREVYYARGRIVSWTANKMEPCGETLTELRQALVWMRKALNAPILMLRGDVLVAYVAGRKVRAK